jgi:hypothetical protein
MRHCVCKKHKLDAKGPSTGSSLFFVCDITHVKKYKLDAKGSSIGSPLLFMCDTAHVKNISYMLRYHQLGASCFLYVMLRM